ncbi:MAG: LysR family transcriptional regulator [Micrococcus sp.]|nr:LysR family transcriptional regulator [Micrococcus sp.]
MHAFPGAHESAASLDVPEALAPASGSHGPDGAAVAVNLPSVDLNLLVLLDALIDEVSVTRAAERVGLSQPAMSHALRRIRRLFGDEILVRHGARSALTPRAERLRVPLREVLHRTAGLLGQGGFDPVHDDREVTIAMNTSAAFVIGRGLATVLAREAPRMRLRLITQRDPSDAAFTREGVDLMLLSEAYATEQPRRRIFEDEWVVVAGADDLTDGSAARLLAERPHVVYESRRALRPYVILREQGIEPVVTTRIADALMPLRLISGSERVGVHRRRVAEEFAREAPLWIAAFPFPAGRLGLDVVWNPWLGDALFRAWFEGVLDRAVAV